MTPKEWDAFISENFGGVAKDNPWEKEPEFTVFRHVDNQKWLGLRFFATREQLLKLKADDGVVKSYAEGERIEIANVKVEPEMMQDIISWAGFLPAFHMSRRHWVTIVLDREVNAARTRALTEMSYNLTAKKIRKVQNEKEK